MLIYSNYNRSTTPARVSGIEIDPRQKSVYPRVYPRIFGLCTSVAVGHHTCQDVLVRDGICDVHGSPAVALTRIFTTLGKPRAKYSIVDLELIVFALIPTLFAGQDRDGYFL